MKTTRHMRDSKLILAGQIKERRLAGDIRPLEDLVREGLRDISAAAAKESVVQEVMDLYRRLARRAANGTPDNEVELQLPLFEDIIPTFRTSPLIRVRREGVEDFLKPDVVPVDQINKHDAWDVFQAKRIQVYREARMAHNKAATQDVRDLGFDTATLSLHEIRQLGDRRKCALCGVGPIAGDRWVVDHETPVKIGEGAGRKAWVHESCNGSKGATPVTHLDSTL